LSRNHRAGTSPLDLSGLLFETLIPLSLSMNIRRDRTKSRNIRRPPLPIS